MKTILFSSRLVLAFLLFLGASQTLTLPVYGQDLKISESSKFSTSAGYEWKIGIDAASAVLDSISSVQYVLHPSYSNPIREVDDRSGKFALTFTGSGPFTLVANVQFRNGEMVSVKHELGRPNETRQYQQYQREDVHKATHLEVRDSSFIEDHQFSWTVFVSADDAILGDIESVEYTLHPSFENPIRKISEKGTSRGAGFFLKVTANGPFTIGVKVIFRDGDTRYLRYSLSNRMEKK